LNNIKHFRTVRGVTQEQLGNICGLGKSTVCKWETGKSNPDLGTIIKLSAYFECTIDELALSANRRKRAK